MAADLHLMDLPAATLRDRLGARAVTALEVARALVERVDAREGAIGAWVRFDRERVLREAAALDERPDRSPLHGVPVALKDIIDTADMPTANGTPLDDARRPERDAALVMALREAGALVAGKAVTTEMAFMHPSATRNPHDPSRTPGGSSAGSAAAVAAGMVPLAVGSQTGGSVLRPASFCGVVGLKPSYGLIPTAGMLVQSPTLDTMGSFARDVAGAALAVDAMAGTGLEAAAVEGPARPPRLALVRPPWWDRAEPAMRVGIEALASALGAHCGEADLPAPLDRAVEDRLTINLAEMAWHFRDYERRGRDELSAEMTEALDAGARVPATAYLAAMENRARARAAIDPLFARFDAILMPAAPGPAPGGLGSTGDSVFNALATFLGAPAISLPVLSADGPDGPLPMGAQLMGRPGDDAGLVRAAAWLEAVAREG